MSKTITAVTFLVTMVLSLVAKEHQASSCAYLAQVPSKISSLDRCESCINKLDSTKGASEEKIDKLIDECLKDVSLIRSNK